MPIPDFLKKYYRITSTTVPTINTSDIKNYFTIVSHPPIIPIPKVITPPSSLLKQKEMAIPITPPKVTRTVSPTPSSGLDKWLDNIKRAATGQITDEEFKTMQEKSKQRAQYLMEPPDDYEIEARRGIAASIGLQKFSYKPTSVANTPEGRLYYSAGMLLGSIVTLKALTPVGKIVAAKVGGLFPKTWALLHPALVRFFSLSGAYATKFGIQGMIRETGEEISDGKIEPFKIIEAGLKQAPYGLVMGFTGASAKTVTRVVTSMASATAYTAASKLITNHKLVKEDIPDIVANSILVGVMTLIDAKDLSKQLQQSDIERLAYSGLQETLKAGIKTVNGEPLSDKMLKNITDFYYAQFYDKVVKNINYATDYGKFRDSYKNLINEIKNMPSATEWAPATNAAIVIVTPEGIKVETPTKPEVPILPEPAKPSEVVKPIAEVEKPITSINPVEILKSGKEVWKEDNAHALVNKLDVHQLESVKALFDKALAGEKLSVSEKSVIVNNHIMELNKETNKYELTVVGEHQGKFLYDTIRGKIVRLQMTPEAVNPSFNPSFNPSIKPEPKPEPKPELTPELKPEIVKPEVKTIPKELEPLEEIAKRNTNAEDFYWDVFNAGIGQDIVKGLIKMGYNVSSTPREGQMSIGDAIRSFYNLAVSQPVAKAPTEIPKEKKGFIPELNMNLTEDITGQKWEIIKIHKEGFGTTWGYEIKNLDTNKTKIFDGFTLRKMFTPIITELAPPVAEKIRELESVNELLKLPKGQILLNVIDEIITGKWDKVRLKRLLNGTGKVYQNKYELYRGNDMGFQTKDFVYNTRDFPIFSRVLSDATGKDFIKAKTRKEYAELLNEFLKENPNGIAPVVPIAQPTTPEVQPPVMPEVPKEPYKYQSESMNEIAYSLGNMYGQYPANARERKSADMVVDAINEINKKNFEKAKTILETVKERTKEGYEDYEKKAGLLNGPKEIKPSPRWQNIQHTIFEKAQSLLQDIAKTPEVTPSPTPEVKPQYAGTETGGITQPPEPEIHLPEDINIDKTLDEFLQEPKEEKWNMFAKNYDKGLKLLFTSHPELNKIPGIEQWLTISKFANSTINSLAMENKGLLYKELPNGGREINLLAESSLKMAFELKYTNKEIAVAYIGTVFRGVSNEKIKAMSEHTKSFLKLVADEYNKLPEDLKNKMAKISEYSQLTTAPLLGIPKRDFYLPLMFTSALTEDLSGNPLQTPSFEGIENTFKTIEKNGIEPFLLRVQTKTLQWRAVNEAKKLTALKYGTDKFSHLPISYNENGKTITKYLPENAYSRELFNELKPEVDGRALRTWARIVDPVNRVATGFGTAYNLAFIPTNLTLDQSTMLALYFKYPKATVKMLGHIVSILINPTIKRIIFDRTTNALIDVYSPNKFKQVGKFVVSIMNYTEKLSRSIAGEMMKQNGGDYLDQFYAFVSSTGVPQKVGVHKVVRLPYTSFGFQAFKSMMNNYFNDPLSPYNDLLEGKGLNKGKQITGGMIAIGFLGALTLIGLEAFRRKGKLDRLKLSNKRGNINFPVGDEIFSIRVENPIVKAEIIIEEALYGIRPTFKDSIKEIIKATPIPNPDYGFVPLPLLYSIPYQVLTNYNFAFQSPIVSNPQYPAEPKNELEKYVLKITGLRPEYTDFIVRSLTADYKQQFQWVADIMSGKETALVNPLMRRVIEAPIEDISNKAISDFYDMYDKIHSGTLEKQMAKVEGKVEKYALVIYSDKFKSAIGTLLYNAKNAKTKEEARQYRKQATKYTFEFFKFVEPYGLKPSVNYNINLDEYFKTQGK